MKKLFCILLLACMLLPLLPGMAHAEEYDPIVKIGLYYDSAALPAANLQNVSGMDVGYAFGYYDADRNFVSTYEYVDSAFITVVKNTNLWRAGSTYSDIPLAVYDEAMGAYSLQIAEYFTLEDAVLLRDQICQLGIDAYLCYTPGGFRIRMCQFMTGEEANANLESVQALVGWPLERRIPNGTCYTVVKTGTCDILYQFDMLGNYPLGIQPMSRQTWFKGYKYYGGFEYYRASGNNLNVINMVTLSDYVKGVIPYEMSSSWPIEALKAQALCAKCYTLNNLSRHKSKGFDLCNTTDCQVYYGTNRATDHTDAAVDGVSGLYVLYDGQICQTYYHSTSGGHTEDVKNIWGREIPYLKGVEDTYLEVFYPFKHTLTLEDITWILKNKGYVSENVVDLYVSEFSPSGNVIGLTAVLESGKTKTFTGDKARTALNSPTKGISIGSHRYTINGIGADGSGLNINGTAVEASNLYVVGADGEPYALPAGSLFAMTANGMQEIQRSDAPVVDVPKGTYVIAGTGSGHNIGMSQWGAHAMANQGFTYEEIIKFYFTGVTVDYYSGN